MSILKQMSCLIALVACLALGAALVTSGDRVNEVCVVAGDIDYCAPRDL